jgi:ABC-2 type transport system permease protein
MSPIALVLHQFRFDQKVFWRSPASVFFTVMLPVIFLLIFASIFGGDTLGPPLHDVTVETYYVPAILTLAVVSATLVNLAINLTVEREDGVLKRSRGTPMPPLAFIAGRIGNSLVVTAVMLVLISVIGHFVYDVAVPFAQAGAVLVTLAIGAASFCALGIALTALIPSEDAAPAITNVTVLPLYFLSGVFIPETEIGSGILHVAGVFPIRPFFEAFLAAWVPAAPGGAFQWDHLAVVALWGVGGLVIALRTFRWTPRSG